MATRQSVQCARPSHNKSCRICVGHQGVVQAQLQPASTCNAVATDVANVPAAWGLLKQATARRTRTHSRRASQDSSGHRVGSQMGSKGPSRDSSRSSVSSQDSKGVGHASNSNAPPQEAVRRPVFKGPRRLLQSLRRHSRKVAAAQAAEPDMDSLEAVHEAPGTALLPAAAANRHAELTQQWVQLGPP